MSRLIDRILTSCQRAAPSMLDDEAMTAEVARQRLDDLRKELGQDLPKDVVARVYANPDEGVPVATKEAPISELETLPVIAADDVAL